MERFWKSTDFDADSKFAAWCEANKNGYVFNHFGGNANRDGYNVIHHVQCKMLHSKGTKASYEKVCSNDLSTLKRFANEIRGLNSWRLCQGKACFPTARSEEFEGSVEVHEKQDIKYAGRDDLNNMFGTLTAEEAERLKEDVQRQREDEWK